MSRARLSKRINDSDAINLFAVHHITQVRRRKNGEIVAVKHIARGWISPVEFYTLQKVHDMLPLIQKFIEGGYRLKQAMWGVSIQIVGTDIELPVGEGLMLAMAGKIFLSLRDGNQTEALKWAAMLALPFGDVVAIWVLSNEFLAAQSGLQGGLAAGISSLDQAVGSLGNWLSKLTKLGTGL